MPRMCRKGGCQSCCCDRWSPSRRGACDSCTTSPYSSHTVLSWFWWNGELNANSISPFLHASNSRVWVRCSPPKALQSPQLISRKVHKNMAPKILALTTPSPTRKKRVVRKKPEIVELDDDVDLLKTGHHWKDHWVIHLISLRGEMQNTFNSPPKQGVFLFSFLFLPFVFPSFSV